MKKMIRRTLTTLLAALCLSGAALAQNSIYDLKVKDMDGKDVSLSMYKGKVLLIVNTATECGFTPQYEDLEKMYQKFKDKGLVILDFPCNQFGGQAPGSDEEIHEFCTIYNRRQSRYISLFPRQVRNSLPWTRLSPAGCQDP